MQIDLAARRLLALCRYAVFGEPYCEGESDISVLHSLAYRHGIDGSLYYALSDLESADVLSEFAESHARLCHRLVTDRQCAERVFRLFDRENIRAMRARGARIHTEGFPLESREQLLVDAVDTERVEELLFSEGFELTECTEGSRLYLLRPYFYLAIFPLARDAAPGERAFFESAWERCSPLETHTAIFEMALADAYAFSLRNLFGDLPTRGVSIRDVLSLGLLRRSLPEGTDTREHLYGDLIPFADALDALYRSWFEGETLAPCMRPLSDLLLARGAYPTLEDYLRADARSPLAYAFLPYAKMRAAHPLCRTPMLYPFALVLRLIRLLRTLPTDGASESVDACGLRAYERRALWRGVGVNAL